MLDSAAASSQVSKHFAPGMPFADIERREWFSLRITLKYHQSAFSGLLKAAYVDSVGLQGQHPERRRTSDT